MISLSHLTTAALVATGRLAAGANPYSADDEPICATIRHLARAADDAQESAMREAERIKKGLDSFIERSAYSVAGLDSWGGPDARQIAEMNAHVAKAHTLIEIYGEAFSQAFGIHFYDAAAVIGRQMAPMAHPRSYVTPEWVAECAALLQLAKAFRDEANENDRAARAAREAAALAEVEARAAAKVAEKAQRVADRKAAKAARA